jgi:hypothetical protein
MPDRPASSPGACPAGRDIAAVLDRGLDVAPQQPQGLARQIPRQRIVVGIGRSISLDRVHHCVDARCRRDRRRQSESQLEVENSHVG